MPTKSAKQERFMQAVAHNPKFAKKVGVPVTVGQEFTKSGGGMAESKKMMAKEVAFMKKKGAPKSMVKHEMKEAGMKKGGMPIKKMASGGVTDYRTEGIENINERKRHLNKADAAAAQRNRENTYNREVRKYEKELRLNPPGTLDYKLVKGMDRMGDAVRSVGKKFGANTMTSRDDDEQMKARKDVKGYRSGGMAVKKMASGGLAAGHKAADGVASKGKTKAKQISMAGNKGMKSGGYC